jgi:cytoskeletal protein CcmA (bactofilin family)
MFSKPTRENQIASMQQQQPAEKRGARTTVPSVIGSGLTISGNLVSEDDVQIDGRVEGDVRANSVTVGEHAVIQGDIIAEEAVIRGRLEGSVRVRKLQLCATARVNGNILHEAMSVEIGAIFQGNCRHSDNPLSDVPDIQTLQRKVAQGANSGKAGASLITPATIAADPSVRAAS